MTKIKILTYNDGVLREFCAYFPNILHEVLGVTIGDIDADVLDLRNSCQNALKSFEVLGSSARAGCYIFQAVGVFHGKFYPLVGIVVLVHRGKQAMLQKKS